MSMTREQAIKHIEDIRASALKNLGAKYAHGCEGYYRTRIELSDICLTDLRTVSREQVEKVFPGCGMCSGWNTVKLKPCANGDLGVQADIGSAGKGDAFGLVVYNKHLASGYVDFPFCPFCGKPQTDEAVDMVMERLEQIKCKN